MKVARLAISCIIAAGILAAFFSCQRPRQEIRLGVAKEPLSGLVFIALEKGFFSKEGLRVSATEYPSGKLALEGMSRGEVSLAAGSGIASVMAIFRRSDARIIATIGSTDNEMKVIARKDRGILRPEGLKGRRIATQEASAVHFFLSLFLGRHGLSQHDVILSFKNPDNLLDAFVKGDIDALSMREPYISRAKEMLGEKAVIFEEPGLYLKTFEVMGLEDFLKNRPGVVAAFLRGLLRAERFANEHPVDAAEIIGRAIDSDVSEITPLMKDARLTVSLDESLIYSLEDGARWAIEEGIVDKTRIPDFYGVLYTDSLKAVSPKAVTVSGR